MTVQLESKLHAIQKAHKHLHRALDCYDQSMLLVDTGEEGFSVQYANEAWEQLTGRGGTTLGDGPLRLRLAGWRRQRCGKQGGRAGRLGCLEG